MTGSVTSIAGTCTIPSKSVASVKRPAAGRPMAKKPTPMSSDWITATPTTPSATPRIVATVSVTSRAPRALLPVTTFQQAPSEFGGTLAIGDEHGGDRERKNER